MDHFQKPRLIIGFLWPISRFPGPIRFSGRKGLCRKGWTASSVCGLVDPVEKFGQAPGNRYQKNLRHLIGMMFPDV